MGIHAFSRQLLSPPAYIHCVHRQLVQAWLGVRGYPRARSDERSEEETYYEGFAILLYVVPLWQFFLLTSFVGASGNKTNNHPSYVLIGCDFSDERSEEGVLVKVTCA